MNHLLYLYTCMHHFSTYEMKGVMDGEQFTVYLVSGVETFFQGRKSSHAPFMSQERM